MVDVTDLFLAAGDTCQNPEAKEEEPEAHEEPDQSCRAGSELQLDLGLNILPALVAVHGHRSPGDREDFAVRVGKATVTRGHILSALYRLVHCAVVLEDLLLRTHLGLINAYLLYLNLNFSTL